MTTVPTVESMFAVIGIALLAVVVLSAIVGALLPRPATGTTHTTHSEPTGGSHTPEAPAPEPTPAPAVPRQRIREAAGVR